jgi:hypothetical protein
VDLKKKYGQGYVVKGIRRDDNQEVSFKCTEEELPTVLEKISKENIENWSLR